MGCSVGNGVYGQGAEFIELDNGIKIIVFCVLNAVGDIYKDDKLYKRIINQRKYNYNIISYKCKIKLSLFRTIYKTSSY